MSLKHRSPQQALERLLEELREDSVPELDWQRIEARLMRESRALGAAHSWWSRWRVPSALLFSAAATAAVMVARRPVPIAARLVPAASPGPLNGDQLALGTRISAGNRVVVIEHAGRARWTLEPHATAFVANAGAFLTVQLERGALSAQVVPSPTPETFAVEVGGTRVAVHGTAFRVERRAEQVLVDVSEGTVAVEPSGSHATPSFLLRRGSRGQFALDGRTGTVEGNASQVVVERGARSHRQVSVVAQAASRSPSPVPSASAAVVAAAPELAASAPASAQTPAAHPPPASQPLQPSISNIEAGVSSALELMNHCFSDETRSSGIRVSASTALTLSVSREGTVQSVTFAPPLAPAVEDCAVGGLRLLTFTPSSEGVTFTRVLELSR